jgi:transcriptional accessory protein Tex/SPT6
MVNLVGVDLRKLKDNPHLQKQLQFICGLGPKTSINFLEKLKIFDEKDLRRRLQLQTENIVKTVVYKNCSAFFIINTQAHQDLLLHGKQ